MRASAWKRPLPTADRHMNEEAFTARLLRPMKQSLLKDVRSSARKNNYGNDYQYRSY
jgi:hypothetical protein